MLLMHCIFLIKQSSAQWYHLYICFFPVQFGIALWKLTNTVVNKQTTDCAGLLCSSYRELISSAVRFVPTASMVAYLDTLSKDFTSL